MKKRLTILLVLVFAPLVNAQQLVDVNKLTPEKEYDNVYLHKIDTDKNKSSFIIWIKKEVKAHKHEYHTETIYVLEGTGEMKIGDKSYMIKVGDYLNVPENTVHSVVVTSAVPLKIISVQAPEYMGKDKVSVE